MVLRNSGKNWKAYNATLRQGAVQNEMMEPTKVVKLGE